jgi:YidC/Oxa1 family membrane protein insertase
LPEFKNPNQGGGGQDSRSFLVLIVVMFGVILGTQYWRAKHPATPAETGSPAVAQTSAQTAAPSTTPSSAAATGAAETPSMPLVQAAAETTTVVENELYKITFSNRGGAVTSWILKGVTDNTGKPLNMVDAEGSKKFGYPLSLQTYDPALTANLAQALYVPSSTGTLAAPATLSYEYSAGNITVHKTYSFDADYVVHASATVLRNGAPIRALFSWTGGLGDMDSLTAYNMAVLDTSIAGKDEHIEPKKVSSGSTLNASFDFAGVSDQYFAAIFMPDQPSDATVRTVYNQMDVQNLAKGTGRGVSTKTSGTVPVIGAAIGNLSGTNQVRLFVGPKSLEVLKSIKTVDGNNLGPVLDFGFWGPIGRALFLGLHFVQEHIASNWGWAIILFTVFINLVILPLRVQGMRSMLKMQRIQPQTDAIKARYGNPKPTDPKMAEMNAEVMALQKEHGVSMFGGCIPTLIQFPLLFAFYTMMTRVVELRHAHWYWLHDLSLADPYHILPIMMVATSFLAQYYTPSPGVDPAQQRMMAFMMPAFSGWMTWQYASGLALYWNVGNIILILQQQVMNRTALGREMKEIAAKRLKAKTIGKPVAKTIQGRK